jgi:hypothetical protein
MFNHVLISLDISYVDEDGLFAAFKTDYYCYNGAIVSAKVDRVNKE